MAESVCEVARNRNKKVRLMSETGEFLSGNREKKVSDDGLNLKNIFYLDNLENNCFTKYSVNNDGVNRSSGFCPHVDEFTPEYKGICPNNDENCRKKRCSDRYDSSESSDRYGQSDPWRKLRPLTGFSGIAVSSSASSGTSDITDPGSPFSTSSEDSSSSPAKCKEEKRCESEEKAPVWPQPSGRCRSEEKPWTQSWETKQQQNDKTDHNFITPETDFKMAPNVPSASSPCGIWTSITENNTANETAHFNNKFQNSEAINNNNNNNNNNINNNNNNINNNNNNTKRLKVDSADALSVSSYIGVVNAPSLVDGENDDGVERKGGSIADNSDGAKVTTRRSSSEKGREKEISDVPKIAKTGVKPSEKTVGPAAKAKQDRNRHQGKITEYFKSQVKSLGGVKRDYNHGKKDSAHGRRVDSLKKTEETLAKKTKIDADAEPYDKDVPVFVKPSPKLLETVMPLASKLLLPNIPKAPDFLTKKPPETKTLFNKILQNHKNRKLAEMKGKTSSTAAATAMTTATVATSNTDNLPVAPTPVATVTKDADGESQTPYDFSTISATSSELPKKVDDSNSNLDGKVQSKQLDSNVLNLDSKQKDIVNCELVISKPGGSVECESLKSPILSAPKTIRFPANCHDNKLLEKHLTSGSPNVVCRWNACSAECSSATGLLEHLQSAHVSTQVPGEKFVCLWVGCKVFDQKSCSRSWLERHVLSHAGNKPFRCIVDGCGQGFSSQTMLERHVNNHFQADVKKALDNPLAHKLIRRNGKKIRYRRQPWSGWYPARMFDFFDVGTMAAIRELLAKMTKIRTGGDLTEACGKSLCLTSQVVARRITANGRQEFLLRWHPTDIIDDEWVSEKDVTRKKKVSIPSLSPSASLRLQELLGLVSKPVRTSKRKNKMNYQPSRPGDTKGSEETQEIARNEDKIVLESPRNEETDLKMDISEPSLPLPPPEVPNKPRPKSKVKKRKTGRKRLEKPSNPPLAVSVPIVDSTTNEETSTPEKVVSLKPKEEESSVAGAPATAAALPEEIPLVPVCTQNEELIPVQTGGIIVDSTKLITPVKTDMILSSPVKLVTSQYIEQPFVQTVMPVQMPVAYQIPVVKLSPPSGMFLPQVPNYIIPPSPPTVFPTSPVPAFRNGFQLSSAGTIQIQTTSTTLQHTGSNFVQSTNASGFQIVQTPVTVPQNIITAFQNPSIPNLGLKSPTLRLLNCQPLILNKPMSNVTMTVTNVTATRAEQSPSTLTMPAAAIATAVAGATPSVVEPSKNSRKTTTPNKKMIKQKQTILPKPNLTPKTTASPDVCKSKKQCLQPSGSTTRTST